MIEQNFLKHFIFATITTTLTGLLLSYINGGMSDELNQDIGSSGAWQLSSVVYFIYSVVIIFGIVINKIILRINKKIVNIKSIYLSGIIAITLHYMIVYFGYLEGVLSLLVALFIIGIVIDVFLSINSYLGE